MTVAQIKHAAQPTEPGPVNECAGFPRARARHLTRRWFEATLGRGFSPRSRSWGASAEGVRNIARLEALRNRHWGKRCFVLGNGPSLLETDLEMLRDEFVIGTNRVYLHPACKRWRRWYYAAVNPNVLEQFAEDINQLSALRFLSWEHRGVFGRLPGAVWLRSENEPRFSFDLTRGMWQGSTITYVAMQVAYHLGFTDVVLLGVDHEYGREGQPNKLVTSAEPDPDHFTPEYFGPGTRWQLPDLAQSELAYRLARLAYEQEGRRIRNATRGGRLDVFPRVEFESLF